MSNVNPLVPVQGNPTTASVRGNFATIKAEIEALQSIIFSNPSEISVFNYMTAAQITDFRAGTLSFDFGAKLQAAIDYATAISSVAFGRNVVTVRIPAGEGQISSAQVGVKSHVNILCEGVIKNTLADATIPCMWFKSGSHCQRLVLDANSKNGVLFGEAATLLNMQIGDVRVTNAGLAAKDGIKIQGKNITFDALNVEAGGQFGVNFNGATNVRGNKLRTLGAVDGVNILGCSHIHIGHMIVDSATNSGLIIDTSHDIKLPDTTFYFDDTQPGPVFGLGYAIKLGENSVGDHVSGLVLSAYITNTGGVACYSSFVDASVVRIASNIGGLPSGNTHPVTKLMEFPGGITNPRNHYYLDSIDVAIAYTGTPNGVVELNNGTLNVTTGLSAVALRLDASNNVSGSSFGSIFNGVKSADQSVINSTALVDVTQFVTGTGAIAVLDSATWIIEWRLKVGVALATTGVKFSVRMTVAPTDSMVRATYIPDVPNAANRPYKEAAVGGTIDFTAAELAGAGSGLFTIRAYIQVNTACQIFLQFAQSTNTGTNVTIVAKSSLTGFSFV